MAVINLPAPILDPPPSPVNSVSVSVSGTGLAGSEAHLFLNAAEVSFKQWVYRGELGLRFTGWDRHGGFAEGSPSSTA